MIEKQLEPYWGLDYDYHHSHRAQWDLIAPDLARCVFFLHENHIGADHLSQEQKSSILHTVKHTGRVPVLCFDTNARPTEIMVEQLTEILGANGFLVLTADARSPRLHNVAYWPFWLIIDAMTNGPCDPQPRQYRVSFLSGVVRYHRLCLWRAMRPYLTAQDVVVINQFSPACFAATVPDHQQHCQDWLQELPWSTHHDLLDQADQQGLHAKEYLTVKHPAWQACVNITGENEVSRDIVLLSEKTWKAYRSGCMVINFGHAQAPSTIKKFGLAVIDELDPVLPWQDKIDHVVQCMRTHDFWQLYQHHRAAIDHNQRVVCSLDFIKKTCQDAVDKLQNILNNHD